MDNNLVVDEFNFLPCLLQTQTQVDASAHFHFERAGLRTIVCLSGLGPAATTGNHLWFYIHIYTVHI